MTATKNNVPPNSTLVMTVLVLRTSPSRKPCTLRSPPVCFRSTESTPRVVLLPRIHLLRTRVNSSEEGTARGLMVLAQSSPAATTWVGPSVVQERQIKQAEALRVGEYVDLGDLPARDCEAHDRERRAAGSPRDYARHPVHQRPARELAKVREGSRLLGHRVRAADLPRRTCGARIRPEHDVGVQHREQRPEVAVSRGREERVHDLPLTGGVGGG